MHILRWIFELLTICGVFPPLSWTSMGKRILYNAYTATMSFIVYSCTVTIILDVVFNVETQEELTENFFVLPTFVISSCKLTSMIANRETIRKLTDTLQSGLFRPMNEEEMQIRMKFEKFTERISLAYVITIAFCAAAIWMPLFTNINIKKLILRAWVPYNLHSSNILFTCTYVHQFVVVFFIAATVITYDNLFNGLIIHIVCQLEILEHRLKNIRKNKNYSLKDCARHHDYIYKYATLVNNAIHAIVPVQFSVSTVMVCFTLYRVAQAEMDRQLVQFTIMMCGTFSQILYYCWSGNEVKSRSTEISKMAFQSDWTSLSRSEKMILLTLMTRSMLPIEFTSAGVLSMNLESFKSLVKAGYSAYSVLR